MPYLRPTLQSMLLAAVAALAGTLLAGCQNPPRTPPTNDPNTPASMRPPYRGSDRSANPRSSNASLASDTQISTSQGERADAVLAPGGSAAINLAAARNEWVSFTVQLPAVREGSRLTLRTPNRGGSRLPASAFSVYQILPMPVNADQAGYVRQTGLHLAGQRLPRALLPLPTGGDGGTVTIDLAAARDPARPADPAAHAPGTGRPVELWVDLKVPLKADPGDYAGRLDLAAEGVPPASADLKVTVHPFVLPDKRNLLMVGRLDWDSLRRLYPDRFEAVTPRLMGRDDSRYLPAVQTLDALVALGQANRAQVIVPRLQPTVKWPAGGSPQIDWRDFDSLIRPWLAGEGFADKEPLGHWPLPHIDHLNSYPPDAQLSYWASAANHFDQFDWLARSAVWLDEPASGAEPADRGRLSILAAATLGVHPRVRVAVPLQPDEVQFVDASHPNAVSPAAADRLLPVSTGLISETAMGTWPDGAKPPGEWLRTDLTGLVPYVGAGAQEEDVRVWAWLAFLRKRVDIVRWPDALPDTSGPNEAAEPGDLIWFYPGEWFGVEQPLASVQLKWLRRAEQDYEYLQLTRDRGEPLNAFLLARSLTKPVEIQARQSADPVYALMTGTGGRAAWTDALALLARTIELHEPGETVDKAAETKLELDITRELAPRDRPLLVARSTDWRVTAPGDGPGGLSPVKLTLGIDVYNPSDSRPENNELAWSGIPEGWNVRPEPQVIPSLTTYQVQPFDMTATVDPSAVARVPRPAEVSFINGFRKEATPVALALPLARTARREGSQLSIDGKLGDWSDDDAVQAGPMALMTSRPAIQNHELRRATTDTKLYTGWSDTDLYVAFHVNGLDPAAGRTAKNFVSYEFRRAWDEDLCEILVQAVYDDGATGPLLHVCPKPNGGAWSEQRPVAASPSIPEAWQPVAGGIRYAATLGGGGGSDDSWRGEVAVPWDALELPGRGRPSLLRFNFSQHRQSDGESASWAGPVDFGRDDALMGCLCLTESARPGMASKE